VDTPNTAPASSTPSATASPSTQTTAETTAAPETPAPEAKAAEASTNATQTTDIVAAKPADTTTTTTTAAKPEPVQPTTTNMVNKLELAPGSPEAKLQSYLEKKTLETPVSMDGINFEAKTAKLTKESDAAVLLLAALLAQYPEANTTETGNENQNSDELSLIRAQTLGESLVKAGVNGKRITIMGMGKRPSPDPTSVASKKSQHIEISVIQ
jgi:outer membrane protein OmpA-like peptidoglycan-associated protein